jgi:glycosyltransferase involved in cell wall biosynthesis
LNKKISIITINLNSKENLLNTINSVKIVKNNVTEFIVVDGFSDDGSNQVIEDNKNLFNKFISEPDTGIYNAMNKGIRMSTGEYILMLNSGDTLYDANIIDKFINLIPKPTEDIIYGNVLWKEEKKSYVGRFPEKLTFDFFLTHSLGHQAMFVKKKCLEKLGLYNEDYRIVSDWAFELDAIIKYNFTYRYWDEIISICPRDGISCKPESWPMIERERAKHLNQFYAGFLPDYQRYHKLAAELEAIKNRKVFRMLKWFGLG